MKFEAYRRSEWRWRLRADNGRIIASGEGYKRKCDCLRAVELVRGSRKAEVTVKQ